MTVKFPPHGKAPGLKRNDRIDAEDSLSSRARELPGVKVWQVATLTPGIEASDQKALTANLVRLYYVGDFTSGFAAYSARVNITTSSASQTLRAAIYVYDDESERRLVKVAETEAVFSAAATGTQTVRLTDGAEVAPGRWFIGVKASDNNLGSSGTVLTVDRHIPVYTYQYNAGVLPPSVLFQAMTKDYTEQVLDVLFMSPDAAQVM